VPFPSRRFIARFIRDVRTVPRVPCCVTRIPAAGPGTARERRAGDLNVRCCHASHSRAMVSHVQPQVCRRPHTGSRAASQDSYEYIARTHQVTRTQRHISSADVWSDPLRSRRDVQEGAHCDTLVCDAEVQASESCSAGWTSCRLGQKIVCESTSSLSSVTGPRCCLTASEAARARSDRTSRLARHRLL